MKTTFLAASLVVIGMLGTIAHAQSENCSEKREKKCVISGAQNDYSFTLTSCKGNRKQWSNRISKVTMEGKQGSPSDFTTKGKKLRSSVDAMTCEQAFALVEGD